MSNDELKSFARDIFNYRVHHDMSQIDFAKLCHVSSQTINSIENGRQAPGKMTRAKIGLVIYANKEEENNESTGAEA
jgi:DNA-binding XRE family transcriptional regulator